MVSKETPSRRPARYRGGVDVALKKEFGHRSQKLGAPVCFVCAVAYTLHVGRGVTASSAGIRPDPLHREPLRANCYRSQQNLKT